MMGRIIAGQPIRIFCPSPSEELAEIYRSARGTKIHPLRKLLQSDRERTWSRRFLPLPFFFEARIEIDHDFWLEDAHLVILRREIEKVVEHIPAEYRSAYADIISKLSNPKETSLTSVARAVEFLTLVGTRFVLDCVQEKSGSDIEIKFQAITEPVKETSNSYRIWFLHNLGSEVDPLLMEMLEIAKEKVKATVQEKEMNWLTIMDRKCKKYTPDHVAKPKVAAIWRLFRFGLDNFFALFPSQ